MITTYELKSYEFTEDFIKALKSTFEGKNILITIDDSYDETAYLLRNKANRKHLLENIEADKQGKIAHVLTMEEVEALAK